VPIGSGYILLLMPIVGCLPRGIGAAGWRWLPESS
jgi:hypothetical protein